jgi:hypothetical protein
MEGLLVIGFLVAALAMLDALALRFGADSRRELGDAGSVAGITA